MIYISEWLPNPDGADHGAEWIELGNNGNAPASVAGWSLSNGTRAHVTLPGGTIPANGVLLIPQSTFHFTIRNNDESIFLYDPQGNLAGESHFLGVAPSGKSVNHPAASGEVAGYNKAGSFFAAPTPGAPNAATATALIPSRYPQTGIISSSLSGSGLFGLALGTAILLALCVTIAIIHHDELRELLFPTHQEIR